MNQLYFGLVQQSSVAPASRPATALKNLNSNLSRFNISSSISVTNSFTMCGWVYYPNLTTSVSRSFFGTNTTSFQGLGNRLGSTFSFVKNATSRAEYNTSLSNNKWYFLVGVNSASNARKIRVYDENGYVGQTTNTNSNTTTYNLALSFFNSYNDNTDVKINGLGIWNTTAFSDAQCDTLANSGDGLSYSDLSAAGLPAPTAYYDCDNWKNLTTDTVEDKTGNGYDMVTINSSDFDFVSI